MNCACARYKGAQVHPARLRRQIAWDESNTIARAWRLVCENFPVRGGLDIPVFKNIAPGSGLGGGSGNAAVMLLFLDRYFDLNIPGPQLNEMAALLGADVPFFLQRRHGPGRGDRGDPDPVARDRAAPDRPFYPAAARVHGP